MTIATPIAVKVIAWIKRHEHLDQFDYHTKFNPLYIKDIDYGKPFHP